MNWRIKMVKTIEGTLNMYTHYEKKMYNVYILDDHSFEVHHPSEPTLKHTNLYDLAGHWKEAARQVIHLIIDRRLKDYI